ncbi:MAG: aldose 1-epimerase family protein [Actinomycetota bacterium]|nr:aldose 1-epimerase family protein [Actinomycetota bacterium]
MNELPSGRQYTIVHGADRSTVVEVGGGLRSYLAGGRELLDGYAEDEMATSARGQPLIPWPNRLRDGRYSWDGQTHQAPLSEPDKGNAIHGFLRFANWTCLGSTTSRVELGHVLHPRPGYPFTLAVRLSYRIGPDGLTVTTTARNVGTQALPYASGQHPYLASPTTLVDDCLLQAPGATYLPTDERGIPTGRQPVQGSEYDFRSDRPIGSVQLDLAFTDLDRDQDGRAWVRLQAPDGRGAAAWLDENYPYLELFTGDSVPETQRRRRGLGIEPMTAPPNAFQSGTDVQRLEPGEKTSASWGLRALP